jgi:hypothetical protein
MKTIYRYLRAFVIALRLTLRGQTMTPPPPTPLHLWIQQGLERLDTIERVSAKTRIDPDSVRLIIDRRETRMSTLLNIVRYHFTDEYPLLLRQVSDRSLILLQATNLDDHHRMRRLADTPALADTPVKQAVAALAEHLESIPKN